MLFLENNTFNFTISHFYPKRLTNKKNYKYYIHTFKKIKKLNKNDKCIQQHFKSKHLNKNKKQVKI